jgi:hypothetical protein
LWWTKWHYDRFFSELSVFPCHFHSTDAPLIVKIGKKNCSSIYHHHWGCTKSLKAVVRGPFITNEKKSYDLSADDETVPQNHNLTHRRLFIIPEENITLTL